MRQLRDSQNKLHGSAQVAGTGPFNLAAARPAWPEQDPADLFDVHGGLSEAQRAQHAADDLAETLADERSVRPAEPPSYIRYQARLDQLQQALQESEAARCRAVEQGQQRDAQWSRQVADRDARIRELLADKDQTADQLSKARAVGRELESDKEQLAADLQALQRESDRSVAEWQSAARQQSAQQEAQVSGLQLEIERLASRLTAVEQQARVKNRDMQALTRRLRQVTAGKRAALAKSSRLKDQLRQARDQSERLGSELRRQEKRGRREEKQRSAIVARLQRQLQKSRRRIQVLETESSQQAAKQGRREEQLRLEMQLEEQRHQSSQSCAKELQSALQRSEQSLTEQRELAAAARQAELSATGRAEALSRHVQQLRAKLQVSERTRFQSAAQVADLTAKLRRATSQSAEGQTATRQLSDRLETMRKSLQRQAAARRKAEAALKRAASSDAAGAEAIRAAVVELESSERGRRLTLELAATKSQALRDRRRAQRKLAAAQAELERLKKGLKWRETGLNKTIAVPVQTHPLVIPSTLPGS